MNLRFIKEYIKSKASKDNLLKLLRNKFFIATLVFFILILFIDEKNLLEIAKSKAKLKELQKEEQVLIEKIDVQKNEIKELDKIENIEKLAREKYLMKKQNEDLFIIVEKE